MQILHLWLLQIGRFPTKEELQKIFKRKEIQNHLLKIFVAIHYEFARKAFADKYNITPNQAGQINWGTRPYNS